MRLTTADVELPSNKQEQFCWDAGLRGFALRLRRGSDGRVIRQWVVQYRAAGRQRRMIVGSAETLTAAEARKQARRLLARVELGEDPQADKAVRRERDEHSLRAVVRDFLDSKVGNIKPRSLELLQFYLLEGPHLKPLLGVPVDKVARKDIAARLLAASKASSAAVCTVVSAPAHRVAPKMGILGMATGRARLSPRGNGYGRLCVRLAIME